MEYYISISWNAIFRFGLVLSKILLCHNVCTKFALQAKCEVKCEEKNYILDSIGCESCGMDILWIGIPVHGELTFSSPG